MESSRLKKILIIEDDPNIQKIARLSLEMIGNFIVHICDSGKEALNTVSVFLPDLILLDVIMPEMDGIATFKALKEIPQIGNIPVAFMTAKMEPKEQIEYMKLGALGVISKPFDTSSLVSTVKELWSRYQIKTRTDSFKVQLEELRKTYKESLPAKIQEIEGAWKQAMASNFAESVMKVFHRLVHTLAGSSGSFRYSEISNIAHQLDIFMKGWLKNQSPIDNIQQNQINFLIQSLKNSPEKKEENHPISLEKVDVASQSSRKDCLIYLVDDSHELAENMALQLRYYGYQVKVFLELSELPQSIQQNPPRVLVMDLSFPEGRMAGAEVIGKLQKDISPSLPIIFMSSHGDFDSRLQAIRARGLSYFNKPVNIGDLVDRLDSLLSSNMEDPYRVLVVDDDPMVSEQYSLILEKENMHTRRLSKPENILEEMSSFRPEVILMDLYMPVNGVEVARVVRQHEAFISVPIILISKESDFNKQMVALESSGGDIFLQKPIQPHHLAMIVEARVKRYRLLRSLMVRDSLTGLYNHSTTRELLNLEIAQAQREETPLSFAMLDIDFFKKVNDTYGHIIGDSVIKSLSRALKQQLRKSDIIGRYGGEEFAVILPNTSINSAEKVMNLLRENFSQISQFSEKGDFKCTFSCGIASFTMHSSSANLNDAADRALYEAKQSGRNCVKICRI